MQLSLRPASSVYPFPVAFGICQRYVLVSSRLLEVGDQEVAEVGVLLPAASDSAELRTPGRCVHRVVAYTGSLSLVSPFASRHWYVDIFRGVRDLSIASSAKLGGQVMEVPSARTSMSAGTSEGDTTSSGNSATTVPTSGFFTRSMLTVFLLKGEMPHLRNDSMMSAGVKVFSNTSPRFALFC